MNVFLWILQALIAFQSVSGALWRVTGYEQAAGQIPSVKALSVGAWTGIGALEIVLALGMILPGILKVLPPVLSPLAAAALAVELLIVAGLHFKYGVNAAGIWCVVAALICAF